MTDGLNGIFKDFENNFSCDTLEDWIEHIGTVELHYEGYGECPTCGDKVTVDWKGKLRNGKTFPQPLCEECKGQ